MNVVREINKINQRELELGVSGSWHDEYKDSAYVYAAGLNNELTEGDIITIFSQYGEVMDLNMPRDKETGKPRGYCFLMYEDQRSTVLAVDNLNGAKILERIIRVDHVKNYKQPKVKGEDGEWEEPEDQSLNAKPQLIDDGAESDSSASSDPPIDPEDPMAEYLISKRKEEKALKKISKKSKSSKGKHKDETPEERRARKARKRERKAKKLAGKSEGMKGVEDLLASLGAVRSLNDGSRERPRERSRTPVRRTRSSRSPVHDRRTRLQSRSRSRSPHAYDARERSYAGDDRGYDRYKGQSRSRRGGRDYE